MKTLLLFLFGLFLVHPAFSQGQGSLFQSQNFNGEDSTIYCPISDPSSICLKLDPDTGNIWHTGNRFKGYTLPPGQGYIFTDTNKFYRSNTRSSFIFEFIEEPNMEDYSMLLSWLQSIIIDKGDYGNVELSLDTGKTWINCFKSNAKIIIYESLMRPDIDLLDTLPNGDIVFSGSDFPFWHSVNLIFYIGSIYPYQYRDRILVRFTFVSDSINSENIGWTVDSIETRLYYTNSANHLNKTSYIKAYPNPVSSRLQIESNQGNPSENIEHLILFNALGQKVDEWFEVPSKFEIETGKYPNGLYYLRTINSGYAGASSVVIQHE